MIQKIPSFVFVGYMTVVRVFGAAKRNSFLRPFMAVVAYQRLESSGRSEGLMFIRKNGERRRLYRKSSCKNYEILKSKFYDQ